MGRPKVKINPKWGNNLKTLCAENGISQLTLAEKVSVSQQTISRIIQGRNSLTRDMAERIIDAFPEYRIQWLLGEDDCKTHSERKNQQTKELEALFQKTKKKVADRKQLLYTIAELCGFNIVLYSEEFGHENYIIRKGKSEKMVSGEILDEIVDELLTISKFHFDRINRR